VRDPKVVGFAKDVRARLEEIATRMENDAYGYNMLAFQSYADELRKVVPDPDGD
jgi:hypothetical protein